MKNIFSNSAPDNRRRTLAGAIAIRLSLLVTGSLVLLGVIYFFFTVKQAQDTLALQTTQRVAELADVLAMPLWELDDSSITQVAKSYEAADNVAGIRIFDDMGEVLYESKSDETGLIVETRPIWFNQRQIGFVELSVSTHEITRLRSAILLQVLGVTAVVVTTIIIASWLLLQNFLGMPLATLTLGIQGFADGDYNVRLPGLAQAELNAIVEQFNSMAGQIQLRDQVLEQRVRERTAVAEAARAQAESAQKNLEAQVWQANGQTQLADVVRGEQTIAQLAEKILGHLCPYIGAQAGALYLLNQKNLTMVGSYAYTPRLGFGGVIALGEGLVGQAAADGKVMHANVLSDTVIISTGLVDLSPRQIAAAPFFMNDEVVGVLELITLSEFTETHYELWKRISEMLGSVFHAAQMRQRMAELLADSQQQAEELLVQEEELRAANEELQAQAENLNAIRNL